MAHAQQQQQQPLDRRNNFNRELSRKLLIQNKFIKFVESLKRVLYKFCLI